MEILVVQENPSDIYEFRVKDHLGQGWFRMFSGMSVKNIENGEALITGQLTTQADVHEVLERIQSLNLILISVKRMDLPAKYEEDGNL